jgi:putative transcriptional regulator
MKSAAVCKGGLTVAWHVKYPLHMRNVVRELRLTRGLSQAALGDVLGVSRQTVNSIETGRYLPSLPLAIALARFFDKAVEEVFDVDA